MTSAGTTSKEQCLAALAGAGDRLADLVQSLGPDDAERRIPFLGWTVADTAAHVVTVAGRLLGDRRRSTAAEDTGRLNAICLDEFADRDPLRLAGRLRADMKLVVERVYPKVDFDRLYPFHADSTISGGGGAAFLLCELLVHGHDMASTTERSWTIPEQEAAIAVRGPAEFWARLLEAEALPTLTIDGSEPPVALPVRRGTVAAGEGPAEAGSVELLLAMFGRVTPSDDRLSAVLAALPQM